MRAIRQSLDRVANRVRAMVARGVVRLVDDARKMQEVQVGIKADETSDGVERWQPYGLSSVPHEGAEALILNVGAAASHRAAVCVDDRRHRPTGGKAGDVVLYDSRGHRISLLSDRIALGDGASKKVAREGDPTTSTKADDSTFWDWVTAVAGATGTTAPTSLTGKVNGGSGTVRAVD